MDPRLQSSFIPKKPILADVRQSRTPMNFFSIISVTVFVVVLLLSAGVFFYQNLLNTQIADAANNLTLSEGEFDPSAIADIIRLDSRLSVANGLLQQHVAVSNFFAALQDVTLQSARFSDFTFSVDDKGMLSVVMKGEAEDFNSVALQSDALTKDTYFKNVVISDFAVEPTAAVGFDVSLDINPSLISYGTSVASPSTSDTTIVPAVPATVSASTTSATASTTSNQQTP